jgi:hypothetical protein
MTFVRSYFVAFRASRGFGRASRLARQERPTEALDLARQTLSLLHQPTVLRDNPPEAAVLLSLTMLVETLAHDLQQPGADESDLRDSLRILENFGEGGDESIREMRREWLPYLQARLEGAGEGRRRTRSCSGPP